MVKYNAVLDFWYSPINKTKWFIQDPAFDNEILNKFFIFYQSALKNELKDWANTPHGSLALVIILDQFPRNMFRGTAKSYVTDEMALSITKKAISIGFDQKLNLQEKQFLYMPLMHSENIEDQKLSVELFVFDQNSLSYAKKHKDIIERFGRFPHRNLILDRNSTKEEVSFLKQPGSSF
jgi:uncharacterized protein (DUF924 family)